MNASAQRFSLRSEQLYQLVRAPKHCKTNLPSKKEKIFQLTTTEPDFKRLQIKLHVKRARPEQPETWTAALVVDGKRIRGVDYSARAVDKHFKQHIPKGWHQNIVDPNLSDQDLNRNRHESLENFSPKSFQDFLEKVTALWNIELPQKLGEML